MEADERTLYQEETARLRAQVQRLTEELRIAKKLVDQAERARTEAVVDARFLRRRIRAARRQLPELPDD